MSCVRAKLCAIIPLWLGAAKICSPAAPPPVGGRTSRGTSRAGRRVWAQTRAAGQVVVAVVVVVLVAAAAVVVP